tara:strand:+ start:3748 stop:4362 length:615 start_codon:yes stop_codon:yes gene_type:complete
MEASIGREKSNTLVEEFYRGGRGLKSTDLKNYTSGDHGHDGFEKIVTNVLSAAMAEAGISSDRWEINGSYFNPTDKELEDPQRLDHHIWIDGKCVLLVEDRAWIDKPFYTLKRAVVRNMMKLPYVRKDLHDDVHFIIVGLSIDIKQRLIDTLDKTMGFGDRVDHFNLSPYRRGYKGGNYFDHGMNKPEFERLWTFLVGHFRKFR